MAHKLNALVDEGYNLISAGKFDKALEVYLLAWDINKSEYTIPYNVGFCYYNLKKYNEALPFFTETVKLNPKYPDARLMRGNSLYYLKRYAEADLEYEEAVLLNPGYHQAYLQKGRAKYEIGDKVEALTCFNKVIEINPNVSTAYSWKGVVLNEMNRSDEAIPILEKAISLNQKNFDPYYHLGLALFKLNKFEASIQYLEKSKQIDPNHLESYRTVGLALMPLGRYEDAIENFIYASELDLESDECLLHAGQCYLKLEKYEEAIGEFDRAIAIKAKNYHFACSNKGKALQALGKHQEAIQAFDLSIEHDSKIPLVYCLRAKSKNFIGDFLGAIRDLNQALNASLSNNKVGTELHRVLEQDKTDLLKKVEEVHNELAQAERDGASHPEIREKLENLRTKFKSHFEKTLEIIIKDLEPISKEEYIRTHTQYHDILNETLEIKRSIPKVEIKAVPVINPESQRPLKEDKSKPDSDGGSCKIGCSIF